MGASGRFVHDMPRERGVVAIIICCGIAALLALACPARALATSRTLQGLGVAEVAATIQANADTAAVPEGEFAVDGVSYKVNYWVADDSYYAIVCGFDEASGPKTTLVIPDTVTSPLDANVSFPVASVAQAAFMDCTTLKSVTFAGRFGGRIGGGRLSTGVLRSSR